MRYILSTCALVLTFFAQSQILGYNYQFDIKGASDTVYLANYFGKQLYYSDTAYSTNGKFQFKKDREIQPGKFAVVFPGQTFFEVIINEPSFKMTSDTSDIVYKMKVEGSVENKLYYDFIQYLNTRKKDIEPLKTKYEAETNEKKKEAIRQEIIKIDEEVKAYQRTLVLDNKQTLIAQIINLSLDMVVPDPPKNEDGSIDSTWQYYYYRNNFWAEDNLRNEALVRCADYHNKLDKYLDKVLLQHPDTISKYVDELVEKMDQTGDLFKYTVNHIINKYSKSQIMGMDAVFVHMGLNYYKNGKAYWADEETIKKISEKATSWEPLMIGKKAPALNLVDTTEKKVISLYSVKAEYTVLYIWAAGCGHCKKSTPKLKKIYDALKPYGVEVYAVSNELENDDWREFVKKHSLDWINVSDTPERPQAFRTTYDVFATPKVYILDKDKKIIAKQIGVEQAGDILKMRLKLPDIDFGIEPADKEDEESHG